MAKRSTKSPMECLFPKVHATMNLKWDIKVFVWAGETPIPLIAFSAVAQILKYEHIVSGQKNMVRKNTHFTTHCVNDSLMTYAICGIFTMVSDDGRDMVR